MLSVEVILVFFPPFETSSSWMPSFSENWSEISGAGYLLLDVRNMI